MKNNLAFQHVSIRYASMLSFFCFTLASVGLAENSFFQNPANISTNMGQVNGNGREYKANEAENQGNTGNGAAIAAGTALTAAATAAFVAGNIPMGTQLMTMAGMEFAQAAQDSGSAQQNGGQESMLRATAGQTGNQQTSTNTGSFSNTIPGYSTAMAQLGVSPSEFEEAITSGAITSPAAAAAALGINLSQEEMEEIASNLGGIAANQNGAMAATGLVVNETQPTSVGGGANAANSGALAGGGAGTAAQNGSSGGNSEAGVGTGSGGADGDGKAGVTIADLLKKAQGKGGKISEEDRAALEKVGIIVPRGKTNIFQIAHRNYKSFRAWRKSRMSPSARKIASIGLSKAKGK